MDDKTQKERLEQELRFLKESFEAEVISKEEFEKGKDRVEKKLGDIEKQANGEAKKEQIPAQNEGAEKRDEAKGDAAIQSKEDGKIKLKVIQDEDLHEHAEPAPVRISAPKKIEEPLHEYQKAEVQGKKEGKFFRYSVVFIVLALVVFFSYSFLKEDKESAKETGQMKFIAACSSDSDCSMEGKIGVCLDPGAKAAKCEFRGIPKTNVIVLNGKNCFNCGTQRVLGILESWFGALNVKEIDYSTEQGKNLAEKFDIDLLPSYILDENITNNQNYGQFKQAFTKKDGSYVLSEDASGASFYFKRVNVSNKLDFFVKENDAASINAEKNLNEFLDNFKSIKFEKHLSTDSLAKELNIKSFPAFLVNNRIKFSGVNSAETIKENFCKMNNMPECGKSLSKSLV